MSGSKNVDERTLILVFVKVGTMRNSKNKSLKHQTTSFEDEVAANIGVLSRYIICHVKKAADVDGRVQDKLLAAFHAYPDFNGDSSFSTWLIGIAKRQIALYYRQASNNTECLSYDENIASNDNILEDKCYQTIKNQEQIASISALSSQYQQILYWHALDGLSHVEIGKKLNITENAVNMRLQRVRGMLCKKMQKKVKIKRQIWLKNATK